MEEPLFPSELAEWITELGGALDQDPAGCRPRYY